MKLFWLLLSATISAPSMAHAENLQDCALSVHAVGSDGIVAKDPLIAPSQVASVADGGIDNYSDAHLWKVRLTREGARINAAYSQAHVGDKVAIFCSSTEVSRPVIGAPSSVEFVFSVPRDGS